MCDYNNKNKCNTQVQPKSPTYGAASTYLFFAVYVCGVLFLEIRRSTFSTPHEKLLKYCQAWRFKHQLVNELLQQDALPAEIFGIQGTGALADHHGPHGTGSFIFVSWEASHLRHST